MGLLRPNEKKSEESWGIIRNILEEQSMNRDGTIAAYGNFTKKGLLRTKVYNYAISFQPSQKEILMVALDLNGNACGNVLLLNKGNIKRVKKTMQGYWSIERSDSNETVDVFVMPYVPSVNEGAGLFPINQDDAAKQFDELMKTLK